MKYTINGTVTVSCFTTVDADSEEEARAIAKARPLAELCHMPFSDDHDEAWHLDTDGDPKLDEPGEKGMDDTCRARPGVAIPPAPEVTDAMVDAYLKANDAYWKRTDELPTAPGKWRTGTPREATRESLRAALGVGGTDGR